MSVYAMRGDELGPCPCGHRHAMCHRVSASRWCPQDASYDPWAEGVRAANVALSKEVRDAGDKLGIALGLLTDEQMETYRRLRDAAVPPLVAGVNE